MHPSLQGNSHQREQVTAPVRAIPMIGIPFAYLLDAMRRRRGLHLGSSLDTGPQGLATDALHH